MADKATTTCGYVHVYTGDGKGKTTAALGLALRAAGAGWRVFFAQFVKGVVSSELASLDHLEGRIDVRQFGQSQFIRREPEAADFDYAQQGLNECKTAILSEDYRLVVLDEANVAAALGLLAVDDLVDLIAIRPESVELVLTGRWAHPRVIERADLVTEMREVKHYYRRGVVARVGVER
jgi:cob(I)alamin adenosyltransferase